MVGVYTRFTFSFVRHLFNRYGVWPSAEEALASGDVEPGDRLVESPLEKRLPAIIHENDFGLFDWWEVTTVEPNAATTATC